MSNAIARPGHGVATIAAAIKRNCSEERRDKGGGGKREVEKGMAIGGRGNIRALPFAPPRYKSRIST